jgi:hypothetical protein
MHTKYFTHASGYVEARYLPEWQDIGGQLSTQHLNDKDMMSFYKSFALEGDITFYLASQQDRLSEEERLALMDCLRLVREGPKGQRKALAARVRAIVEASLVRRIDRPGTIDYPIAA